MIRVSHAPISAYGRAAYQTGRGEAIQRNQAMSLEREKMMMNQEARNRSFAIQEAAGHRAERTMMADAERKGRLDAAGFEQMRAQRQTIEQNLADWDTLSGSISEPEYKRGVIAIRSGKTPQYLKQQRESVDKPPEDIYRSVDRNALFRMADSYARAGKSNKRWGPNWRQKDLITQYEQFLRDNNYSDLSSKDKSMLELQWEEAMVGDEEGSGSEFEWDPSSKEVQQARRELRAEPGSDIKSEVGNYMQFLEQEGGEKAVVEFQRKWENPNNRPTMIAQLRQRYGNVR